MKKSLEHLTLTSNIRDWFERFEFFVLANDLKVVVAADATDPVKLAAKQKNMAVFVSRIDQDCYKLLKSLSSPTEVTELAYEAAKKLLVDHLDPKVTKWAQRVKFHKIKQLEGQQAQDFISVLRAAAAECQFTNYEESLLDQLLAGLKDEETVSELIRKEDLTLNSAIKEILAREQSKREAHDMANESSSVHRVKMKDRKFRSKSKNTVDSSSSNQKSNPKPKCDRCKLMGHLAKDCKTKCFGCGMIGHVKSQCYKKKKEKRKQGSCNNVGDESASSDSDEGENSDNFAPMYYLFSDSSSSDYESELSKSRFPDSVESDFQKCGNFNDDNLISNSDLNVIDHEFSAEFSTDSIDNNLSTYLIQKVDSRPMLKLLINDIALDLEFDSGSSLTVISQDTLDRVGLSLTLTPSSRTLVVANGTNKPVRGYAEVDVQLNSRRVVGLRLFVVEGYFPSLFGRPWIEKFFGEDWLEQLTAVSRGVDSVETVRAVEEVSVKKSVPVTASTVEPVSVLPVIDNSLGRGSYSGVKDLGKDYPRDVQTVKDLEKDHSRRSSVKDLEKDHSRSNRDKDLGEDHPRDQHNSRPVEEFRFRSIEELRKSDVFKPGLGTVKGYEARLVLKEGAQPVMLKARHLPYAIRGKVEKKLGEMVSSGILEKVDDSPWGTPVVPVKKSKGDVDDIRICGDYKSTLNPAISTRQYPIPSVEECFNTVTGGTWFSVVDIKQAYNNLIICEEDQMLTTLNTHLGLYKWKRLPYGISSSAAIFQSVMDQTIEGIPMTTCRIDDILIGGRTREEHNNNLCRVISALERRGLKCKLEKSQIEQEEVTYLGHSVSAKGTRPLKSKVESLKKNPAPTNVNELVSFLGAVNYYRRYLPNLSTLIAPLERLRSKDVEWKWTKIEQKAYEDLKDLLCSERVLMLYDPSLPLKLDTDASSCGLGAVMSHILPNGEERPVEYISRTLSAAERRYSQIDREALAIVWAVKRLHIYLYGREFTLVTDHKALTYIFGTQKTIPEMSASRIVRWAIFLMNYSFTICYRQTKEHCNADMLSRLPKTVKHAEKTDESMEVFAVQMEEALLDAKLVAKETKRDPIMSKVLAYVVDGWPNRLDCDGEMKAYWSRKTELSVELGCLTWGSRVVIPPKLREWVLTLIHSTHVGMVGMKRLARNYVWFPGIDARIEETVRSCDTCSKFGKSLPKLPDHPWTRPQGPFERVHIDFCELKGSQWLVLQDAYSKWPEVIRMNSNTKSGATIKALRSVFARTGIPVTVVSDNGPQLVSDEIKTFYRRNGINHISVPTYSPKSNGLCERYVGTFKSAIKKMCETCPDVDKNVANFLLMYRNTPHSTTNQTPAMLACNRSLRFNLHQIKPADRRKRDDVQPEKEQKVVDSQRKQRFFVPDQQVLVQLDHGKTWQSAKVVRRYHENSNVYDIQCNGRIIKKHADKMKAKSIVPVVKLKKQELSHSEKEAIRKRLDSNRSSTALAATNTSITESNETSTLSLDLGSSLQSDSSPTKSSQRPRVSSDNSVNVGSDQLQATPSTITRPSRQAKCEALVKMQGMT